MAAKRTTLHLGPWTIPVALAAALKPHEGAKLVPLCGCGARPRSHVACPACGADYGASWRHVPHRGYPVFGEKDTFLLLETSQVDKARASVAVSERLEPEAAVPLSLVLGRFVITEHRVAPLDARAAGPEEAASYGALVAHLAQEGLALLARFTLGAHTYRYAITGSPEAQALVLLRLEDPQPQRREPLVSPGAREALPEVARAVSGLFTSDPGFAGEPDRVAALAEDLLAKVPREHLRLARLRDEGEGEGGAEGKPAG